MSGFSYFKGGFDQEFSWKDRSAQLNANLYPLSQASKFPYNPYKDETSEMSELEFKIILAAIDFWQNNG